LLETGSKKGKSSLETVEKKKNKKKIPAIRLVLPYCKNYFDLLIYSSERGDLPPPFLRNGTEINKKLESSLETVEKKKIKKNACNSFGPPLLQELF
jgi:hypothetical protein